MSEIDNSWWRTPVAVLRLVLGSLVAVMILLGAVLAIAEAPGTVRALVLGGGAMAIVAVVLGWGMKGLWPVPGQLVQMATVVILLPVAYLAALDAYDLARSTTLLLFAATIVLIAVPAVLRLRRRDQPLAAQVVSGEELVLRADRLTALVLVELCVVAIVMSLAAIRYAPTLVAAVGWAGVVLFGALALWVAPGLTGRPVLTASADGVIDRSRVVGWGRIDWDEVGRFTTATRGVAIVPRHPQAFGRRTWRRRVQTGLGASVDGFLLSTMLADANRWSATEMLEAARRRWQR